MKDYFIEHSTEGDKDMARCRILELENGNKIKVQATDPYGFWNVSYESGNMPKQLKGEYTSYDEAKKAVQTYLEACKKEIVGEKLTIGELKTKDEAEDLKK